MIKRKRDNNIDKENEKKVSQLGKATIYLLFMIEIESHVSCKNN